MPRLVAICLAAVLVTPVAALGAAPGAKSPQTGSSAAAPATPAPKEAQDVARALVPKQRWNDILDAFATSISEQLVAAESRGGKKPAPDLAGKVKSQLHDQMRYEDAVDVQARALADTFTPGELKQIAQFYSTPAGRKLVTDLPKVQSKVSDQLQQRFAEVVPRIVARVAPDALPKGEGAQPQEQGRTPPPGPGRP